MLATHRLFVSAAAAALSLLPLAACTGSKTTGSAYATPTADARDSLKAQSLTRQATPLMESDPAKAERLLRDALAADLFHGPAHNNLGVLYLERGELYEAANEFEWARQTMPGHPDPRMNLAVTLERAGRIEEALDNYATALEVYPDHVPTMQAMVRCQLRHDRVDDRTPRMLEKVALAGETEEWREWAQGQLARLSE